MTTQWNAIETAPRDTVIVTDKGFAIRSADRDIVNIYGKTVTIEGRWLLCDSTGNVPWCADNGDEISEIEPTKWVPLSDIGLKQNEAS